MLGDDLLFRSFVCNLQRFIQNIKAFLQLFLRDDQRRDNQHGMPVGVEKQAMIQAILLQGRHLWR